MSSATGGFFPMRRPPFSRRSRGEERAFFVLALETAMRMRECYTLDVSQVNIEKRTIYLQRSKNGDSRTPRLEAHCSIGWTMP